MMQNPTKRTEFGGADANTEAVKSGEHTGFLRPLLLLRPPALGVME
jgi:hypothetical protein